MAAAINFARKQTVFYKSLNLLCAAAQDKKVSILIHLFLHNDNLPEAFHSLLDFTVWINKDHKKDIFENE